jgi:hypothetical protein
MVPENEQTILLLGTGWFLKPCSQSWDFYVAFSCLCVGSLL